MSGGNKGKKSARGSAFSDLGNWQSLAQRYAFAACLAAIVAVVVYSSASSKDGQVGIV